MTQNSNDIDTANNTTLFQFQDFKQHDLNTMKGCFWFLFFYVYS